jgi:hypothetical protein
MDALHKIKKNAGVMTGRIKVEMPDKLDCRFMNVSVDVRQEAEAGYKNKHPFSPFKKGNQM